MDYLAIVSDHLNFIERFFETTASPLEARKEQIEKGEAPFDPKGAPEDYDGPEYELEWQEADEFIRVLGQSALALLEKALHDYLRDFSVREGWDKASLDKGNWFKNYCAALETKTAFNWTKSPVSYKHLEQINLSRNDFTHDSILGRIRSRQTEKHFAKYPDSAFADESEVAYFAASGEENDEPWSLNVTREALLRHIGYVREFCTFVDGHRMAY